MAYEYYNPNPVGRNVGDCSVRAIAKALDTDWETAYILIMLNGYAMCDMPSSDSVFGSVLRHNGFRKAIVPDECPECYTVSEFSEQNKKGTFVVGTGGHVVTVIDGRYYDSWDSGQEIPVYVWYKEYEPIFGI